MNHSYLGDITFLFEASVSIFFHMPLFQLKNYRKEFNVKDVLYAVGCCQASCLHVVIHAHGALNEKHNKRKF